MADQTNAEVSDERLRELLPCPFCGGPGEYQTDTEEEEFSEEWIGCTSCGATTALEVWNRRSVTSQASEGAGPTEKELWEAGCLTRDQVEKWTNADLAAHPEGVRTTLKFLLSRLASPSKRVERLETAPDGWKLVPEDLLTHLGDWQTACQIARQHAAPATADSDDASYWDHQLRTIAKIRQALQGGRS